jgi:hypothetical protein
MNEPDWWVNATAPQAMLCFLQGLRLAGDRKLRLLAAACCRRIWRLLVHDVSREAVEVGERFADGLATERERQRAAERASDLYLNLGYVRESEAAAHAAYASLAVVFKLPEIVAGGVAGAAWAVGWTNPAGPWPLQMNRQAEAEEQAAQAALLRCVFGPLPFRPVVLAPVLRQWQDGLIVRMANAIYEERELPSGHLNAQRLAVLADALTDAGCNDADLFGHLRGPGPHVRGCFVVDLLTGRE